MLQERIIPSDVQRHALSLAVAVGRELEGQNIEAYDALLRGMCGKRELFENESFMRLTRYLVFELGRFGEMKVKATVGNTVRAVIAARDMSVDDVEDELLLERGTLARLGSDETLRLTLNVVVELAAELDVPIALLFCDFANNPEGLRKELKGGDGPDPPANSNGHGSHDAELFEGALREAKDEAATATAARDEALAEQRRTEEARRVAESGRDEALSRAEAAEATAREATARAESAEASLELVTKERDYALERAATAETRAEEETTSRVDAEHRVEDARGKIARLLAENSAPEPALYPDRLLEEPVAQLFLARNLLRLHEEFGVTKTSIVGAFGRSGGFLSSLAERKAHVSTTEIGRFCDHWRLTLEEFSELCTGELPDDRLREFFDLIGDDAED